MAARNLLVKPTAAAAPGTEGGPARNGHFAVAAYNIRDGRAAGLLSAARAFDHANVDLAVVQEVKLKDPKFAPRR